MSACESYSELISAHLDGALAADERARMTDHLASCEACRTYMAELAAIRAALSGGEEVEVPAGFAEGVMQRVRESAPQRKKQTILRRFAPLAACAAVFVVVFAANGFSGFGGASAGDAAEPESMPMTTADSYSVTAEEGDAGIVMDDAYSDEEAAYDLPTERAAADYAQTETLTDMTTAKGAASAPVQLCAPYSDAFDAWLSERGVQCIEQGQDVFIYAVDAQTMADFAAFLDESGTAYVQEGAAGAENVIVLEK